MIIGDKLRQIQKIFFFQIVFDFDMISMVFRIDQENEIIYSPNATIFPYS